MNSSFVLTCVSSAFHGMDGRLLRNAILHDIDELHDEFLMMNDE